MTTVRQLVVQATSATDAHRRQTELVRASLLCRGSQRRKGASASRRAVSR
ncbi:hypothetical protein [Conexibacter sp. SYSU D00693]|nr:hypothetical protein [Conexibacter sp. SYSU D00693]